MELEEILRNRRSVRVYEDRPVEAEKIRSILKAASSAPSAGNLQAYEIVLVSDPEVRATLARVALDQAFLASAPVVLVFVTNPLRSSARYGQRGRHLYALQDATIACAFAHIRAADLGLGSVWVGAYDDEAVRRAVGAPEGFRPVAILPIGYPAETPEKTTRRNLDDLVHTDQF